MSTRRRFLRAMRLVRERDFAHAYRRGNRARGDAFTVVAIDNGSAWTRLGLSVGRVVWRSAVKRNRVRRVYREAFRLAYPELPGGVDLVLIATQKEQRPELERTRRDLVRLAHKAHRRYREKLARESAEGAPA
jgi:ribonuclease P protein component